LNGTHQLPVYVDDDNLLGRNINTVKPQTLLDANNEVVLEVNPEKTWCMFIYFHQIAE